MARRIFWTRRRKGERRNRQQTIGEERRFSERRSPTSDSYLLVVGDGGLDRVGLLSTALILLLMASLIAGTLELLA